MYKNIVRPALFRFGSDYIHEATIKAAESASKNRWLLSTLRPIYSYKHRSLEQKIFGLTFPNPLGLAAGFDKNGTTVPLMEKLGFGFVEVGSITANASSGNPKPRTFRLTQDHSLINRMGLNNDGVQTIARRLKNLQVDIPVGMNIAKTHDPEIMGEKAFEDYSTSFHLLKNIADYMTLNSSCPNTTEGKTFEEPETLNRLLQTLEIGKDSSLPAVLIKFSVDLEDNLLYELLDVCEKNSVDGYVATNTSSYRDHLTTPPDKLKKIGAGGLSGQAIKEKSTEIIRKISAYTRGEKTIIGVGGISSSKDAIEKLKAGADLLQIYTGLVYEGPGLVKRINREIADYLKEHNLSRVYHLKTFKVQSER